jgi:protein transport protein SEC61 subunit gamma-like protein
MPAGRGLGEKRSGGKELGLTEFIESTRRLAKVLTRPSRKEAMLVFKITLLGIAVLGGVAFAITLLFYFIGLSPR